MAKKKVTSATKKATRRRVRIAPEKVFEFLKLTSVRLVSVTARLDIVGGKIPVHAQIKASPGAGVSQDGDRILGNVELEAIGKPEGEEQSGDCSTVRINAHYQCIYAVHDAEMDDIIPHIEVVANTVMYVAWPYLRELCNSLTNKMGIPPITLPMLAPPQTSSEGLKTIREAQKSHAKPRRIPTVAQKTATPASTA